MLGERFRETPLRRLLVEAVRYGDTQEVIFPDFVDTRIVQYYREGERNDGF